MHRQALISATRLLRRRKLASMERQSFNVQVLARRESCRRDELPGSMPAPSLRRGQQLEPCFGIRRNRPTLVAMGNDGITRADEDELCAIHLRNLLEGRRGSASGIRKVILAGPRIADFHDPSKAHLHPGDLEIALDIDRYDFAVRIRQEEGRLVARAEPLEGPLCPMWLTPLPGPDS